jgi:hypothetical protein
MIWMHPRYREAIEFKHRGPVIHHVAIKVEGVADFLRVVLWVLVKLLAVPLDRVARLHIQVPGVSLLLHCRLNRFFPLFKERSLHLKEGEALPRFRDRVGGLLR